MNIAQHAENKKMSDEQAQERQAPAQDGTCFANDYLLVTQGSGQEKRQCSSFSFSNNTPCGEVENLKSREHKVDNNEYHLDRLGAQTIIIDAETVAADYCSDQQNNSSIMRQLPLAGQSRSNVFPSNGVTNNRPD